MNKHPEFKSVNLSKLADSVYGRNNPMPKSNDAQVKTIEKLTDEYGQLHEDSCGINLDESYPDSCDCAMSVLVKEVAILIKQAELRGRIDELSVAASDPRDFTRLAQLQAELKKLEAQSCN